MPGLLYADDLVLCSELVKDMRVIVGSFIEVCRRRAGKSKVMLLGEEEGLECELYSDGIRLDFRACLRI